VVGPWEQSNLGMVLFQIFISTIPRVLKKVHCARTPIYIFANKAISENNNKKVDAARGAAEHGK